MNNSITADWATRSEVKKQNHASFYQVVGGTLNMMISEGLSKEVTCELRPEKTR